MIKRLALAAIAASVALGVPALLVACGGGTSGASGVSGVSSDPGNSQSPGGAPQVTHQSCNGYPMTGTSGTTVCDQRSYAGLGTSGSMRIDGDEGDVVVVGSSRGTVDLNAFVYAQALTQNRAHQIATQVVVHTDADHYYATGPNHNSGPVVLSTGESWWVGYDAAAPSQLSLDASTVDGAVTVASLAGSISLTSTNGSIDAEALAGDLTISATSGPVTVDLFGASWSGSGVGVQSVSGNVVFDVPAAYSATFSLTTISGNISSDFGGTPQSSPGQESLTETVGSGGATLSATTNSGDITLRKKN